MVQQPPGAKKGKVLTVASPPPAAVIAIAVVAGHGVVAVGAPRDSDGAAVAIGTTAPAAPEPAAVVPPTPAPEPVAEPPKPARAGRRATEACRAGRRATEACRAGRRGAKRSPSRPARPAAGSRSRSTSR
jgi:hypothetical protein